MFSRFDGNYDRIDFGLFKNAIYHKYVMKFYEAIDQGEIRFEVSPCFCGEEKTVNVAKRDKFNLPAYTAICLGCGLTYNRIKPDARSNMLFYRDYYRYIYESRWFGTESEHADMTLKGPGEGGVINGRLSGLLSGELSKERFDFLFSRISPDDPPGRVVLDFGCNYGSNLSEFRKHGFEVVGYDYGECNIVTGRKLLNMSDLHVGGFDEIIASGRKFDIVTMHHVLEHFQDLRRELTNLTRILNPRAIVFISLPGLEKWGPQVSFNQTIALAHPYYFTEKLFLEIFTSFGFETIYSDDEIFAIFRYTNQPCAFAPSENFAFRVETAIRSRVKERPYVYRQPKQFFKSWRYRRDGVIINRVFDKLDQLLTGS